MHPRSAPPDHRAGSTLPAAHQSTERSHRDRWPGSGRIPAAVSLVSVRARRGRNRLPPLVSQRPAHRSRLVLCSARKRRSGECRLCHRSIVEPGRQAGSRFRRSSAAGWTRTNRRQTRKARRAVLLVSGHGLKLSTRKLGQPEMREIAHEMILRTIE